MIKTVLKDELIKSLPNIFSKILTIDFFDEDFVQKIKQNKEASLIGIATNDFQQVPCENSFDFLHSLKLGKDILPFGDKTFTLIIGENILSNCFSLAQTIGELNRILMDDGILITSEPNIQYYIHVLKLIQGVWDNTLGEKTNKLHFFTPCSLADLLSNSSFHVRILSPIETDSEDAFPLGSDGFVHVDRYHIGPLTPEEHKLFLIKSFMAVVSKNNGENIR